VVWEIKIEIVWGPVFDSCCCHLQGTIRRQEVFTKVVYNRRYYVVSYWRG